MTFKVHTNPMIGRSSLEMSEGDTRNPIDRALDAFDLRLQGRLQEFQSSLGLILSTIARDLQMHTDTMDAAMHQFVIMSTNLASQVREDTWAAAHYLGVQVRTGLLEAQQIRQRSEAEEQFWALPWYRQLWAVLKRRFWT